MKTKLESLAVAYHLAKYGKAPDGVVHETMPNTVMVCFGLSCAYYIFSNEKIVDVWFD